MIFEEEEKTPEVLCARTIGLALAAHVLLFVLFWAVAAIHFKPKETVVPIDMTVVVNENLDGEENEPPPLDEPPPPEPPKPEPVPEPEPEPPKVEEHVEALEKIVEKKPEKPKEKEKKKEEKKPDPEPPKKTKEELRKERQERIKNKLNKTKTKPKIIVKDQPSGNGRTAKQTLSEAEIRKLLGMGVKAGTVNSLPTSMLQFCYSRIQMAMREKWEQMNPKIGRGGSVVLAVRFDMSGRIVRVRLAKGCGDPVSDRAAHAVASAIGCIPGLDAEFLRQFSKEDLEMVYKVSAQ